MRFKNKNGFTLVEMVITIALLGIVTAISLSVVYNVNNSLGFSRTAAERQYDTAFSEKTLNNYISTAEKMEKNQAIPNPLTAGLVKISMKEIDNKNVICIEETKKNTGTYKWESVLKLTGVEKATFTVGKKATGHYSMTYVLTSKGMNLKGGATALNMTSRSGVTSESDVTITYDTSTQNTDYFLLTMGSDPRTANSTSSPP